MGIRVLKTISFDSCGFDLGAFGDVRVIDIANEPEKFYFWIAAKNLFQLID